MRRGGADHPAQPVIRAHKAAVRHRLHELIDDDTADEIFLLLEGAIAHRSMDADGSLMATARRRAEALLTG